MAHYTLFVSFERSGKSKEKETWNEYKNYVITFLISKIKLMSNWKSFPVSLEPCDKPNVCHNAIHAPIS